jgi:hypothetical protein
MTGELTRVRKRTVDNLIGRTGEYATIYRPDGSEPENKFGKVEDDDRTHTDVGEVLARRTYESYDQRPSDAGTIGGRVTTDTPRIICKRDANVQEEDELVFPDGERYSVDKKVARDTHLQFRVTRITNA